MSALDISLLAVTMLLWGSTPLFEKLGLRDVDALTGILIRSGVITAVLLVIYLVSGRLHELAKVPARGYLLFCASGLMAGLVGMWTYFYLLKEGHISRIVPIAAAYPLVTAILGIAFLGESLSLSRIVGICLTVTGIILIKQS